VTSLKPNYTLYIFYHVIYFGCVTDDSYSQEKAFRFLTEFKNELAKVYKGTHPSPSYSE